MQEFLDGIEWALLRRQKMILQELAAEDEGSAEHLDALVATLHGLQVAAHGMGYDVWEH